MAAGDAGFAILGKVVERLVDPVVATVGRQLGYIFSYKRNIKNLHDKVENLDNTRGDVRSSVEARKRNLEEIGKSVSKWLSDADKLMTDADGLFKGTEKVREGCLSGLCPNVKQRYLLSRNATKKAFELDKLQREAAEGKYTQFATASQPGGMLSTSLPEVSSMFESRISVMNEVMDALKDDRIRVIGICGMGGVGKTTMVEEVRKRARSMDLFEEVAMTTVSQDQDVVKIQGDLAEMLGLSSIKDVRNVIDRRDILHARLISGKKTLVILDDLWKVLDLQKVGIPIQGDQKGCKVVITSRNDRVCSGMGIKDIVYVPILTLTEAWDLFRENAGNRVEDPNLHDIARKIARECGGLPIAIVTLATALASTEVYEWKEALQQLEKGYIVTTIPEMDEKVYKSVRLSYDFLGRQLPQAQPLLLLCCQLPEDSNIQMETLVYYSVGLRLFGDVQTMEEVRNRVYTLLKRLRSSSLLLAGTDEEGKEVDKTIKLHDIVRDVCLSILSGKQATKDQLFTYAVHNKTLSDAGSLGSDALDYSKLKILNMRSYIIRPTVEIWT